ncbi:MAG TPA: DUF1631 family protein, partial [Thiolapillus brandeum]|nr:DUF1631 family protein [Thiolapillus brandeum]
MASTDKIVYLGKTNATRPTVLTMGKYSVLKRSCENLLIQGIRPLLSDLLSQVDDDLYHLAENSTSNTRQILFFDAMRSLRLYKEKAEQAYLRLLENTFASFWEGRSFRGSDDTGSDPGLSDELALVEKDALEEELAVTTMASKARGKFHRELSLLDKRFAYLLGRKSIEEEENPAGPAVLSNIFRVILDEWETEEVLPRIVVYKCFERVVLSELGDLYKGINHLLAEKGILPELSSYRKERAGCTKPSESVDHRAETHNLMPEQENAAVDRGEVDEYTPSLKEIWQYIQQMEPRGMTGSDSNAHLPVLPRDHVMEALSDMQGSILSGGDAKNKEWLAVQERIRQQLSQTLCLDKAGKESHRIAEREQQTIDIILMLFDHVLDDPNLPDAMRVL